MTSDVSPSDPAIPPIYCLSFRNEPRKARLQERLAHVGLTCTFLPAPVTATDVRAMVEARRTEAPAAFEYRAAAVMLSHLQMIRLFVEGTDAPCGIFCEDDIHLRRTIKRDLPAIVSRFEAMQLDVLLLGYLWPVRDDETGRREREPAYTFHDYEASLWGCQMYLLSRAQAVRLLDTHTLDHAITRASTEPFTADWIITKIGRRLRIYPMLAVEEGAVETTHAGQVEFHLRCAEAQYDPERYI